MRKILTDVRRCLVCLVSSLLLSLTAFAGEPDQMAELQNFVVQDCGSCHGLTFRGGLGPPLRPENLDHLPAAAVSAIIREGIPGTAMPPWKALLSDQDIAWISQQLKSGSFLVEPVIAKPPR